MLGNGLPKEIRRRLYSFARGIARPFTDSRRARFIRDMIPGLLISGHVHLSKVARAISPGDADIHGVDKRLSRHLGSEHWDMSPVATELLTRSAHMVTEDTLLTAEWGQSDLPMSLSSWKRAFGRAPPPRKTGLSGWPFSGRMLLRWACTT
jgi:hypothetical protein